MEDNQKIRTCTNCRYFVQHFVKSGNYLTEANCGHCINKQLTVKQKPKAPMLKCCDKWESALIKKEKRKKLIKNVLKDMAERLQEIAIILKDDEE